MTTENRESKIDVVDRRQSGGVRWRKAATVEETEIQNDDPILPQWSPEAAHLRMNINGDSVQQSMRNVILNGGRVLAAALGAALALVLIAPAHLVPAIAPTSQAVPAMTTVECSQNHLDFSKPSLPRAQL